MTLDLPVYKDPRWDIKLNAALNSLQSQIDGIDITPGGGGSGTIYNVTDETYGALGDDSNDDTLAIQSAINAAGTAGGGVVYLPKGTYKTTSALSLALGVLLIGDGQLATTLHQTSTTSNGITLGDLAEPYLAISKLQLLGPGSGTGDGLHLDRTTSGDNQIATHVSDVLISGFGNDGLFLSGAITSTAERVVVSSAGRDAIHVEKSGTNAGTTSLTLLNCYSNNAGRYDYYIDDNLIGSYISLISCGADNSTLGYYLKNVLNAGVYACGSEGNSIASFKLEACRRVVLSSCFSADCGGKDFWITGSSARITLQNTAASAAGTGHTAGIQVDSGSHALVVNHENSSSVINAGGNIFTGTVTTFDDSNPDGVSRFGVGITGSAPGSGVDLYPLGQLSSATGADTDKAAMFYVRGDTFQRLHIRGDGRLEWGTGSATPDVALYRDSAHRLRIGSSDRLYVPQMEIGGTTASTGAALYIEYSDSLKESAIRVTETAEANAAIGMANFVAATASKRVFATRVTGDVDDRLTVRSDGNITFGDGTVRDTNLYRLSADTLATDDDLVLTTVGKGIRIKTGTNATMGEKTLASTSTVVSTTAVTATSQIFLSYHTLAGTTTTPLSVSNRTAGTSFTIAHDNGNTSTVWWLIVNPSP